MRDPVGRKIGDVSSWINQVLLGGARGETICARCFLEDRLWAMFALDALFYVIDGDPAHCLGSYVRRVLDPLSYGHALRARENVAERPWDLPHV